MNLIKSLLVVVVLLTVAVAQDETEGIFAVQKVEGKTCIATTKAEFETLTTLVTLIDVLTKAKSHGTIDSTMYAEKVAEVMKDAREAGVVMTKSRKN